MISHFDSHAFYQELVASGLADKTADSLTKTIATLERTKYHEAVTVRELDARIKETELKIELVRREVSETRSELSKLILTTMIGMGLVQLGAIYTLFFRIIP